MKFRKAAVFLLCVFAFPFLNGCASNKILISPGEVTKTLSTPPALDDASWSMWVNPAVDKRDAADEERIVGTVYTRFKKTPIKAYLDKSPALYLQEQLSKYLLRKGHEASTPELAKTFLTINLTKFEVSEIPGSVWDELNISLSYQVNFSDRTDRELGQVLLDAGSTIKTPLRTKPEIESAFRQALADTFESLINSSEFKSMVQEAKN